MPAVYATKSQIIALAPELVDDATLDALIAMAASMLDVATWGDKLFDGHWTLSAHLSTVQTNQDAIVASRGLDKLSESYAVPGDNPELMTTKYGRLHAMLAKTIGVTTSRTSTARGWPLPDRRIL